MIHIVWDDANKLASHCSLWQLALSPILQVIDRCITTQVRNALHLCIELAVTVKFSGIHLIVALLTELQETAST